MKSPVVLTSEVLTDGFVFLEGPRWRDGHLWVSDIKASRVYSIDESGGRQIVADIPNGPSGIGFLPDGTPLVVSMTDRRVLKLVDGEVQLHADLSALEKVETNDMVIDTNGRAYVGCFGFDLYGGEAFKPANILLVTVHGKVGVAAENLVFPNGMVLLEHPSRLVVAETFGHRLTTFDIADDGTLTNRRNFAQWDELHPDGICLDEENGIWVSSFSKGCFLRVVEGGLVTHRINVPGRHAVACQLGGKDGKTLFCLTTEGSLQDIGKGISTSRVEIAEVDVPAAGSP